MASPVVGILTHSERVRYGAWDDHAEVVGLRLVRAAQATGARVVLIPHDDELVADPRQVLARVDGVVAAVGADPGNGAAAAFPEAFARRAERDGTPVLWLDGIARDVADEEEQAAEVARFVAGLRR